MKNVFLGIQKRVYCFLRRMIHMEPRSSELTYEGGEVHKGIFLYLVSIIGIKYGYGS
jgi:hypothetical protein